MGEGGGLSVLVRYFNGKHHNNLNESPSLMKLNQFFNLWWLIDLLFFCREEFRPNKPRPCDLCRQMGHEVHECQVKLRNCCGICTFSRQISLIYQRKEIWLIVSRLRCWGLLLKSWMSGWNYNSLRNLYIFPSVFRNKQVKTNIIAISHVAKAL